MVVDELVWSTVPRNALATDWTIPERLFVPPSALGRRKSKRKASALQPVARRAEQVRQMAVNFVMVPRSFRMSLSDTFSSYQSVRAEGRVRFIISRRGQARLSQSGGAIGPIGGRTR